MLEMGSEYYFLFNPKGSVGLYTGWLAAINIQNNEVYYQIAAYDDLHYTLITESDWQAERKEIELGTILGINVGCDVLVGDFGALYFETSFMLNLFSETKKFHNLTLAAPRLWPLVWVISSNFRSKPTQDCFSPSFEQFPHFIYQRCPILFGMCRTLFIVIGLLYG